MLRNELLGAEFCVVDTTENDLSEVKSDEFFDFDELVKNKVSANIGRTPKPPGNSCIGSIALSRKYPIKELPGPER